MASLALGLAGAGIGSFLLPGFGTSLGWSIGVMIGGRLGHKSHQSPQLKDLRVHTSEYGTPIPIGYGTIRIAGWLEWATDKVPHKHKQGGKGGPKVTTTTYTCSFAVGLLETSFLDGDGALINNPIVGILRIWANGRLVYGEGSPADALPMTIYYGTEDQLPDPTIEAKEGVGQVSANRGKAYVVFTDLELAQFGDAIPNFTFEVVASGSIGLEYYSLWPVDYDYPVNGSAWASPYDLNGVDSSVAGQLTLHRYRNGNAYGPGTGTDVDNIVYYDQSTYDLFGNLLNVAPQLQTTLPAVPQHLNGSMNNGIAYVAWQQTGVNCTAYQDPPDPTGLNSTSVNNFAWLKDGVVTYTPAIDIYCAAATTSAPGIGAVWLSQMQLGIVGGIVYWNGNVYAMGCTVPPSTGEPCIKRYPAPDGAVYTPDHDAVYVLSEYTHDGITSSSGNLVIGTDGYLYCTVSYFGTPLDPAVLGGHGYKLIKLDAELNFIAAWYGPAFAGGGGGNPIGSSSNWSGVEWHGYWIANHGLIPEYGAYNFAMYRMTVGAPLSSGTMTLVDYIPAEGVNNPSMVPALNSPLVYIGGNLAAFRGGILTLGSGTITLAEMVANVSQHVGYAVDEYDVSQLTDVVRGACISQRTSGRAAIEAWQPAYGFGAVESNFANKFVKWGGDIQATIPVEDLGAREYGTEPGDPIKRTLVTDKDLPRTVEVIFLNKGMDYQEGMQYWEGPVKSDSHVALSMALVFTDAEGKAIAENIGVNAMVERNKFTFSLPRKWAHLEPTDVIALVDSPVRIVSKDEQGYTHIVCEGISTRIGEWIVAPVASEVDYVPQVPPNTVRTDLLLLDTALARDGDDQLGFNSGLAGTMAGAWPGAGLYRSVDGGATYDLATAAVDADEMGVALTVFPTFAGGNIVDESSTLTVRLGPGSGDLESTNYLGLINGANLFALGTTDGGYELAQFRDATLIATTSGGSKTYELTGFLRGRRGTEWAMDTHATEDKFCMLPAHNVAGEFADLGAEYLYKAVTSGSTLSSATAVPFTNDGAALKPYSPVMIGGGRNAAGDIVIHWHRRTRIGGVWANNTDVPLSEDAESYILNFYSSSTFATLVYSDTATVETYTMPAADQTANFGGLKNPLYVGIQQLGSYGYGYEGLATI